MSSGCWGIWGERMSQALRSSLLLMFAVSLGGFVVGQTPPTSPGKSSGADAGKPSEPAKKTSLDKMKLPPGALPVVVEDLQDALWLFPKVFLMTPEKLQELTDRIAFLESQLKVEKKLPHSCKLTGKVEGDVAVLEAEYIIPTTKPNTTVALGLQGGHLTRDGDMDGQIPQLEFGDDGYAVVVATPGTHTLTLKLEVPVGPRRAAAAGGGSERGFDLGLPGAAVTTIDLDLPANVKELRWNDNL